MVGIPIEIHVHMCRLSIHSGAYSVVGIRGTLGVQEGVLPSLSGVSIVNFMWSSNWFM